MLPQTSLYISISDRPCKNVHIHIKVGSVRKDKTAIKGVFRCIAF